MRSTRIILSLLLAFGVSHYVATAVIYPESSNTVAVRPDFIASVEEKKSLFLSSAQSLPKTIAMIPSIISEKILPAPKLPPPVVVEPPVVYPTQPARAIVPTRFPVGIYPPPEVPTIAPPRSGGPTSPQLPPPTQTILPTPPFQIEPTEAPGQSPGQAAAELLGLINGERGRNNAQSLVFNDKLNKAAQDYASLIGPARVCDHDYQSSLQQRLQRVGYPLALFGENITCGIASPRAAFTAWLNSKLGHKENMLNPAFKSAGLGYSSGYWVLDLGAR